MVVDLAVVLAFIASIEGAGLKRNTDAGSIKNHKGEFGHHSWALACHQFSNHCV